MLTTLKQYYRDPLYKNSFFILLNSLTGAFFGFFFWMLAAQLYSSEDVGLATQRGWRREVLLQGWASLFSEPDCSWLTIVKIL